MSKEINRHLGLNLKLDHIAYAVKSTDETIEAFKIIYPNVTLYKCLEKNQDVYISYLSNDYDVYKIELVEGASKSNPVENILKSRDVVLYHLCYAVDDFNEAIKYFKDNNFFMITAPFETSMEKGKWACHFLNPKCGIIEITGEKK